MIRGMPYGSIFAALTITLLAGVPFPLNLPFAALTWVFVLLCAGLLLILATPVVLALQDRLRGMVSDRLYGPVAVLAAIPFGILICLSVMKLFGWADPCPLLQDGVSRCGSGSPAVSDSAWDVSRTSTSGVEGNEP